MSTEVRTTEQNLPMGFDDSDSADDVIIPRVRLVQSLSPDRKAGAEEGDVINSLTKQKYNGKAFVPVFKFNSNVEWLPRSEGGGIACQAQDGKNAHTSAGEIRTCATCRRCEFQNIPGQKSKAPDCTKYINFFGFFEDEMSPIILSFSKTSYNEGKRLYSIMKLSMQNMWNNSYKIDSAVKSSGANEWYILTGSVNAPTSEEARQFAANLYKMYSGSALVREAEIPESNIVEDSEGFMNAADVSEEEQLPF